MLNKKTKILYITGTRADYGLMRSALLTINKACSLDLVVTGMHLEKKFGNTINEIKKDKLKIKKTIRFLYKTDRLDDLSKNLGNLLIQLSDLMKNTKYDYALVEGDRMEALALAIAVNSNNIPVIHQGGGDISGSIDNQIRNAITSFSDYHLAGNIFSSQRLESMGVSKKYIYMFGEPGLDDIVNKKYSSPEEVCKKYNIDRTKKLILLVHHPDTKEKISPKNQIEPLLKAVKKIGLPTIIVYANNDPGGMAIIGEAEKYKNLAYIKFFSSLPRADFLGIMNVCDIMIGNSSSGIIEAPLFNLPFINVGHRQKNRLADNNAINCGFAPKEIIKKINENINNKGKFKIKHVYGKGEFTKSLINFLKSEKLIINYHDKRKK